MRPIFADTIVTEAGIDLAATARTSAEGPGRSEAYREWRRSRVLFMRSTSEAERAVVDGAADLPAQRRRADL